MPMFDERRDNRYLSFKFGVVVAHVRNKTIRHSIFPPSIHNIIEFYYKLVMLFSLSFISIAGTFNLKWPCRAGITSYKQDLRVFK